MVTPSLWGIGPSSSQVGGIPGDRGTTVGFSSKSRRTTSSKVIHGELVCHKILGCQEASAGIVEEPFANPEYKPFTVDVHLYVAALNARP